MQDAWACPARTSQTPKKGAIGKRATSGEVTSESVSDYRRVYQIESQPDTHYPLATYENPKRKRCLGNDDSPLATIAVHTYIHTYMHYIT